MKTVLVVLVTMFLSACAAPGEKRAPATTAVEPPKDSLGDWNSRDPIERLLQPATSDLS